MIVYAVVDDALSPDFPLGDALEVFVRREDAERFIEGVLDAGGLNEAVIGSGARIPFERALSTAPDPRFVE